MTFHINAPLPDDPLLLDRGYRGVGVCPALTPVPFDDDAPGPRIVQLTPVMRSQLIRERKQAGISQRELTRLSRSYEGHVCHIEAGAVLTIRRDLYDRMLDLCRERQEATAA